MRLLGLDFETTGLDPHTDEITEIGYAIVDTNNWKKPLLMRSQLCTITNTISKEIADLTGISNELLAESGVDLKAALVALMSCVRKYNVTYMVAHNAPFDREFLNVNMIKHEIPSQPLNWIDTKKDIPWSIPIRNTSLVTVAAEHGFLNPFPHAALFDVFTMLKVMSKYNIDDIVEYRDEPTIILRALVDYDNKDMAKERGFRWQECEGRIFDKKWVKAIKQRNLEAEIKECKFETTILK